MPGREGGGKYRRQATPSAHQKKCNTMSQIYPGDVLDTNAVIEFLTSEEALELPDKIEEVKSKTFKSS